MPKITDYPLVEGALTGSETLLGWAGRTSGIPTSMLAPLIEELLSPIKADGSQSMEADLDAGGNRIVGVSDPIDPTDVATKEYADGIVDDDTGTATTKAPSQAAVTSRVEYWNIQEKRFAGGAPANGIDDDGPAIRAALAAFRGLNVGRYSGGGPQLVLPGAFLRLDSSDAVKTDRALDVTGLSNLMIEGRGIGATTLNSSGAWSCIKSDDTPSLPLYRVGLRGFTVRGPGGTATGASGISDGIDLGATNNCLLEDIIIYAHRRGLAWQNAWNTNIRYVNVNGQGSLACYDGYYAKDGDTTIAENAVKITGGQIQGTARYGFRGESITGSYVSGLEIVQIGQIGVYFGASPGGKPLKWFDWVGGMVDTCPNLILIDGTGAPEADLVHLSELWVSNATNSVSNAIGVDVRGVSKSSFSARILNQATFAANIQNCDSFSFSADVMTDYDKDNTGSPAVILNGSTRTRVNIGTSRKKAGSSSAIAVVEQGSSDYNYITGVFNGAVNLVGVHSSFNGVSFSS